VDRGRGTPSAAFRARVARVRPRIALSRLCGAEMTTRGRRDDRVRQGLPPHAGVMTRGSDMRSGGSILDRGGRLTSRGPCRRGATTSRGRDFALAPRCPHSDGPYQTVAPRGPLKPSAVTSRKSSQAVAPRGPLKPSAVTSRKSSQAVAPRGPLYWAV